MTQEAFIRNTIRAVLLVGICLAFALLGREPGWEIYLTSGLIALVYLILTLTEWRGSSIFGVVTTLLVIMSTIWDRDKPVSAAVSLVVGALSLWIGRGEVTEALQEGPEDEPDGALADLLQLDSRP